MSAMIIDVMTTYLKMLRNTKALERQGIGKLTRPFLRSGRGWLLCIVHTVVDLLDYNHK